MLLWARKSVAWLQPLTACDGLVYDKDDDTYFVGEDECCVSTTIDCIDWRVYDRDYDTCCCGMFCIKSVACPQPLTALIGECMIAMITLVVVAEGKCCVSTTILFAY